MTNPSPFIQAHRMMKAVGFVPFRHWRLALVVLALSYVPLGLIWLAYTALVGLAVSAVYGPEDGSAAGGEPSIYAELLLQWTESPLFFLVMFGVLSYPFLVWGMAVWWRSQGGIIRVLTPLRVLWRVGVLYLPPVLLGVLAASPLVLVGYGDEYQIEAWNSSSQLILHIVTFATYWLIFRLSKLLVDGAQGQAVGIVQGWQATASDNRLCLFLALDLTVITAFFEAINSAVYNISDARWERAYESGAVDLPGLPLLDTVATSLDFLVVTWLIFVELALVWSLAQRVAPHRGAG